MIPQQQAHHEPPLQRGFILTNANCSTTGLVIPLCTLEKSFGPIESCIVTTMQAISGTGYPDVPSLDIIDNVVPYIGGEEEKMEWEILGNIVDGDDGLKAFDMRAHQPLRISALCNRVPVIDGHLMTVWVRVARRPPPSPQQVREALVVYMPETLTRGCPSAPVHTTSCMSRIVLSRAWIGTVRTGLASLSAEYDSAPYWTANSSCFANNVSIGAATSRIINAEMAVLNDIVSTHTTQD